MTTMASQSDVAPPNFEPNTIQIDSITSSKIQSVSVYSSHAEITRLFQLNVKTGHNQVHIDGLPFFDRQSLRVEGKGSATIHDVTISDTPTTPSTSSEIEELRSKIQKKDRLEKSLDRTKKSIASLQTFLGTLSIQHITPGRLDSIMGEYEATAEKLDNRLLEQEDELKMLKKEIENEASSKSPTKKQGTRASIGVYAEDATDIEIVLKYAVDGATWKASYDIRVNTSESETSVTLIYKAVVRQNTKESWENVPLTLETASPTYGVNLPSLTNWTLSVYEPKPLPPSAPSVSMTRGGGGGKEALRRRARLLNVRKESSGEESDEDMGFGLFDDDAPILGTASAYVSSSNKPNLSGTATFRVPGLASIPSDSGERTFTITTLKVEAVLTWEVVPKIDATKVALKAKILNDSEFTLLSGKANVYQDGSFIAKTDVPAVSPNETFECPLGLDPSIRITYHPLSKKTSTSGFSLYASKSTTYVYTRRLTVHNTKSFTVPLLKIIDQIPVSEDERITVKLINPPLKITSGSSGSGSAPDTGGGTISGTKDSNNSSMSKRMSLLRVGSTSSSSTTKIPATTTSLAQVSTAGPGSVKVSEGVVAQWNGAEVPEVDLDALGKDGKMNWLCEVKAQSKVNLVLQWEVCVPVKTRVVGL